MKIIIVGNNVYQSGDITAKATLDLAKGAVKGKNAIYYLQKGETIEMRNDVFKSAKELKSEVSRYIHQGFKVGYVFSYGKN